MIMARAIVVLRGGAKVTVEGTEDEVVSLVARLGSTGRDHASAPKRARSRTGRASLPNLIVDMIGSGFFKEPKQLGSVKSALEQSGQFYPLTTLAPAMLRLARARQLRRIKGSDGRWTYVG